MDIVVLLFEVTALLLIAQDRPATHAIDLGGLREAKAVVAVSDSQYRVTVSMRPVQAFDAPTNARLNRAKARELALWALAKHLIGGKSAELTIAGARIEKAGSDGEVYRLVLHVPRRSVAVVRPREKGAAADRPGATRIAFDSALFTRKREYAKTLEELATAARAELHAAEEKAGNPNGDFPAVVAALTNRWVNNFEKLAREIQADLLLLSLDQEELAAAIARHQANLLGRVKETLQRAEKKQKDQSCLTHRGNPCIG